MATEHLQGKAGSETDLRMDGFISWDTLPGITVKIHNQVPAARELGGDFSCWFRDKKNKKSMRNSSQLEKCSHSKQLACVTFMLDMTAIFLSDSQTSHILFSWGSLWEKKKTLDGFSGKNSLRCLYMLQS